MYQRTTQLLTIALLISAPTCLYTPIASSQSAQVEAHQTSWHHLLSQALLDIHAIVKESSEVPEHLSSLVAHLDQAPVEEIVQGLLVSIEILKQDGQLPDDLKQECARTIELITELQSALDMSTEATRGGILNEFPSALVGVLRVVNALRVSGTVYINPPAGTTALRVNGDSVFNGNTEFFGDVTITGTLTAAIETSPSPIPSDLDVNNINLPNTTSTVGKITKNNILFIHNFGTNNTFAGVNSGNLTLTGNNNTGLGVNSLTSLTIANNNTALGANTLDQLTAGGFNTAVGSGALSAVSSSSSNTAVGYNALAVNNAGSNTAVGSFALANNTSATGNTALGASALTTNTTGINNTAIGLFALINNSTGNNNVAVGRSALNFNTTGNFNTALGTNALLNSITGSNNIAIGNNSGANLTTTSDNIEIGNTGVVTDSGAIRIGTLGTHTTCYIQGISGVTTGGVAVPVLVDANGQLGTTSSSRRYKDNIRSIDASVSEKVLALNPVEFNYKSKPSTEREYGLIAEEVEQLLPELVVHNQDNQAETVRYHVLPSLLVRLAQSQHALITQQQDTIQNHEQRIDQLEQMIRSMKQS